MITKRAYIIGIRINNSLAGNIPPEKEDQKFIKVLMCIPCTWTDWPFIQATLHVSITFHIELTALSPNNHTQCSYQYNKAG